MMLEEEAVDTVIFLPPNPIMVSLVFVELNQFVATFSAFIM